jgi:hypothetical protein
LRPAAHATSSKPAIKRRIQDTGDLHGLDGAVPDESNVQGRPYSFTVTAPRHECRGFLSVQQEDLFPASTQTAR